jgi:hypothetical protein
VPRALPPPTWESRDTRRTRETFTAAAASHGLCPPGRGRYLPSCRSDVHPVDAKARSSADRRVPGKGSGPAPTSGPLVGGGAAAVVLPVGGTAAALARDRSRGPGLWSFEMPEYLRCAGRSFLSTRPAALDGRCFLYEGDSMNGHDAAIGERRRQYEPERSLPRQLVALGRARRAEGHQPAPAGVSAGPWT